MWLAVSLPARAADSDVRLVLDTYELPDGARVIFTSDLLPPKGIDTDLAKVETEGRRYRVSTKANGVTWEENKCECSIYEINLESLANIWPPLRFSVQGRPEGTFPDQTAKVRFHVLEGDVRQDSGYIKVPVRALSSPSGAQFTIERKSPVRLQGDQRISFKIRNVSRDISLRLISVGLKAVQHDLWSMPPDLGEPFDPSDLAPSATRAVDLKLAPVWWRAFDATLPRTSTVPVEIAMEVAYSTGAFENKRFATIVVPIRFEPSFPSLALFIIVGVAAGSLVESVYKRCSWTEWFHRFWVACVVAVFLNLLAMAAEGELSVLGLKLSPSQALSGVLLGVVIGGKASSPRRLTEKIWPKK